MGIINGETLKATSKGFKKVFNEKLIDVKTDYEKIATVVKSNSITTDYAWLGDTPKMRQWVGDRVIKDLKAHSYTITKKRWEATVGMDRDYILYDNLGVMKPKIQQLAEEAKTHYDELVFELLETNNNCYDGSAFFGTHTINETHFSNLGNKILTADSFLKARAEMRGVVSENGRSLKIRPNLLVIPPELEQTAIEILKKDILSNGESNITKGMSEYLVVDDLSSATSWYLMDTSKVIKPMVVQKNREITFTAMDNPSDESVFMRAEFRYGVDSEDNVGYGLWQLAYKSTGTVA